MPGIRHTGVAPQPTRGKRSRASGSIRGIVSPEGGVFLARRTPRLDGMVTSTRRKSTTRFRRLRTRASRAVRAVRRRLPSYRGGDRSRLRGPPSLAALPLVQAHLCGRRRESQPRIPGARIPRGVFSAPFLAAVNTAFPSIRSRFLPRFPSPLNSTGK